MDKKYAYFLFTFIVCQICLTSVGQDVRTSCRPNGYVQTFGRDSATKYTSQTMWVFDINGRLIIDSIFPVNSCFPHTTTYYRYNKDSIIGDGNHGWGVLVLLDKNGVPIFTSDKLQREFSASYNTDGTLRSVQETEDRPGGTLTIDSFVYLNGNIISYRERVKGGGITRYSCTYYEDKYKDSIYYGLTPFGLRLHRFFISYIDIQAFSKNLMKTRIRTDDGLPVDNITSFDYTFGNSGKAIKLKRVVYYPSADKEQVSEIEFIYPCDK